MPRSYNEEDRQGFHSFRGHGEGGVHSSGGEEDEHMQDDIKTIQ